MKPFLFCALVGSISATFSSPAFSSPFVVPPPQTFVDKGIFLEGVNSVTDPGIFNKIPEGFTEPRVRALTPTRPSVGIENGYYSLLPESTGIYRFGSAPYQAPVIRPRLLENASSYRSGSVYLMPQWKRKEAHSPFAPANFSRSHQLPSTPFLNALEKRAAHKSGSKAYVVDLSSGFSF